MALQGGLITQQPSKKIYLGFFYSFICNNLSSTVVCNKMSIRHILLNKMLLCYICMTLEQLKNPYHPKASDNCVICTMFVLIIHLKRTYQHLLLQTRKCLTRSLWLKIVTAEQIVKMIKLLFEISKTIQNSISVCACYLFVGLLI